MRPPKAVAGGSMMFRFFIGPAFRLPLRPVWRWLFATGEMLAPAACFLAPVRFDADFRYPPFAAKAGLNVQHKGCH